MSVLFPFDHYCSGQPSEDQLFLNRDHPLAEGLVAYVIGTPGGLVNLVPEGRAISAPQGSTRLRPEVGLGGIGRRQNNTASSTQYEDVSVGPLPALTSASRIHLFCRVIQRVSGSTANLNRSNFSLRWGGGGIALVSGGADNTVAGYSNLGAVRTTSDIAVTSGAVLDAWVRHDGNQLFAQVNDAAEVSAATSALSTAAALGSVRLGVDITTASPGDRTLFVGAAWLRNLPEGAKRLVRENPYLLLAPRRIPMRVSGAGGTTITATASLSAAVQLAAGLTAGLSAAVQTTPTSSATADAAVQAAIAAQAQLDAAVQSAAVATAGLQAAVQAGGASTSSLHAAVELARTATAVLELAVQTQGSVTASLSAQVQATGAATTALDAFVQAGSSVTTGLAAAVLREALASAGLEAALQTPRQSTAGMSAALQSASSATTGIDIALQSAHAATVGLSAQVQDGFAAAAEVSAAVQAGLQATAAVQAAISIAATTSLALGAAVMVQRTVAAAMEAAVQAAMSRQAALSAYVEDQSGNVFFSPAAARTVVVEPESRVLGIGPENRVLVIT